MKRCFAGLLALLLITALCACAKETIGAPLTVNGTPIDAEVFTCYLDMTYGVEGLTTREARVAEATQNCIRYVAVNSAFRRLGLSLTDDDKEQVRTSAGALWRVFGNHYKDVGVSKETYLKIRTSEAYVERMRLSLFDRGGTKAISDEILRGYFASNYVAVKTVRSDLFEYDIYGNHVELKEEKREDLLLRYNAALGQINAGVGIDFIYASLISAADETAGTLQTEIVKKDDPNYPEGFFEAVEKIAPGKAGLAVFGESLYLLYRVAILSDPAFFEAHRAACLRTVSEPYLQNEITALCNGYSSVRRTSEVEKCCVKVEAARG